MAFMKYALPVLAAANAAYAASCGSGDTISISSQGDADGYADCKTLKGDVELSEHLSGSLNLNGVEKITGSLIAKKAENISSLSASSLTSIESAFHLEQLTTLTTLSFGSLTSVGSIEWTALPELQTLDFEQGVKEAGDVHISNTGLTSLDGISLKTCGEFDITDNTHLKNVNVNELTNTTGLINFAGNMESLEIELPNLSSGTNITIRNVSVVSVPSLHNLSGQLAFWGNTFESFSAPNLTKTGDIVFNDNDKLGNLTLPQLKTVDGGFQLARDNKLSSISLPKLETINGALDFSGHFNDVSIPKLEEVKGGFNMQSTGDFSCDSFDKARKNKVIRGTYECDAKNPNPTTKGSSSGTKSGSGSSSSSSGAAVANNGNMPAMGLAAVFGALLAL